MTASDRASGLAGLDAVELARMLSAGLVSAREVLEAHLLEISRNNDLINAICTLADDGGRAAAHAADEDFAHGRHHGPLHGLPIVHKDVFETSGLRTTFGSATHRTYVPDLDATLVQRCRAAGAVLVGKSNTPQFATGGHTSNRLFGTTVNPSDPSRTAGGSSGGSAAALAACMAALATGSDMAGSLRIPSAFCGTVGMRPSMGRVPLAFGRSDPVDLTVAGPMGRCVEDVALLFSVLVGAQGGVARPRSMPGDRRRPRAAWCPTPGGVSPVPAVAKAMAVVPVLLTEAGFDVDVDEPDLLGARDCFEVLRGVQYSVRYSHWLRRSPELLDPLVRANVEAGLRYTREDDRLAETARLAFVRRGLEFFTSYDVLVLPGSFVQPFLGTQWTPEGGEPGGDTGYLDWLEPFIRLSVLGAPVVSVPLGYDADGLPMALQVAAAPGSDVLALQHARKIEEAIRMLRR